MTPRDGTPRRRAFATIFALFLLALVGAALLALTSLTSADARRSTRAATGAQLRQLLHAGAAAAVQRLREANELPGDGFDVPLPRELADARAGVRVSRGAAEPNQFMAVIDARLGDQSERQQVLFVRDGATWRIESVRQ